MSHKERKCVGSFYASTADGEYEILLNRFAEYHISGTRRVEGLKELLTDDGEPVNYISKGKYHHVTLDIDLFSDDPNAP